LLINKQFIQLQLAKVLIQMRNNANCKRGRKPRPQVPSDGNFPNTETNRESLETNTKESVEEANASPTHTKQNDEIEISQEEQPSSPQGVNDMPLTLTPPLETAEPPHTDAALLNSSPQSVMAKKTLAKKPRTKKTPTGITLTPEERAVYDFYSHLWFVQVPPTINETTKTHCAALAPVIKSQEHMDSLYKFTRDNCKFIKSKVIYLGNMVNCVNQWLQTQTKPAQATLQAATTVQMDEDQARALAIKAVAMGSEQSQEIQAVSMLKDEKWVVVVSWNTKYFEKPETFESEERYVGAFKEMCQVWNSAKKKERKAV
jgi:hypothetical protein